jgi:hypothetical protein
VTGGSDGVQHALYPFKSEDEARQNVKDFVNEFIERLDILEPLPEKTD